MLSHSVMVGLASLNVHSCNEFCCVLPTKSSHGVRRVRGKSRGLMTPKTRYTIAIYARYEEIALSIGTVFINNRTQAVRLPVDVRLPEGVHKVEIRARGHERIIAPIDQTWDSFFLGGPVVSDDFLPERAPQCQSEREAL